MRTEDRDGRLEEQKLALRREFHGTLREQCFTEIEIAEALGITRQRVGELRGDRRLIGFRLPPGKCYYHPRWQIADGAIRRDLDRLLGVADECGYDAIDLHLAVAAAYERSGAASPALSNCAEPGATLEQLVRAWGDIGA